MTKSLESLRDELSERYASAYGTQKPESFIYELLDNGFKGGWNQAVEAMREREDRLVAALVSVLREKNVSCSSRGLEDGPVTCLCLRCRADKALADSERD